MPFHQTLLKPMFLIFLASVSAASLGRAAQASTATGGDYGGPGIDPTPTPATAMEQASATISATALAGGVFEYTVTLKNTGTTNLETFWYSWTPGQDYMPVSPTNIQSPANWTSLITGGGADGFAIQWMTSSAAAPAPLTPGGSLAFSFDSTATPDALAGESTFFPSTPVGTSFVYGGAPFSDAGFRFVVTSVIPPVVPAVVNLTATKPKVAVGNGKGAVAFTRTGDLSSDLTVSYSIKGSAVNGTDYKLLTGSAVLNAGSASKVIKIKPKGDLEGANKVALKLVLEAGASYTLGTDQKAKVKIFAEGQ